MEGVQLGKNAETKENRTIWIISWNGLSDAGGVERVMQHLKKILEEQNTVKVIDRAAIEKDNCFKNFLKISHPVWNMILMSIYARKVKKDGDILIGNGFNAPFVKKDINFAHGSMYGLKEALGIFPWGGSTLFELISHKNSAKIISVSKEAKKILVNKYKIKKDKIIVVNNCADTDSFTPLSIKRTNNIKILFVGRLEAEKGLSVLLRLAEKINGNPGWEFYIAAPCKKNENLFRDFTNVYINTEISKDRMNLFYNSGDVLFFPSKYEGFGMCVLEALAVGIPVVGSCVGAIQDLNACKFPGVHIIKSYKVEDILKQLEQAALDFADPEKRIWLHKEVEKKMGIKKYEERMKRIIFS